MRTAPVQGFRAGIPWSLHLRAWDAYSAKWGRGQSAERLAERGGFHASELDGFVPGWRQEVSEIGQLREQLGHAGAAIEQLTKEREEYRMRWLGSMTTRDAELIRAENERLRALVMLGDFSGLRPNSDSFKLVQQIRREQSAVEQALHPEEKR